MTLLNNNNNSFCTPVKSKSKEIEKNHIDEEILTNHK